MVIVLDVYIDGERYVPAGTVLANRDELLRALIGLFWGSTAPKDAAWCEIEAIYLHPAHCGQGIGAALIEHACRSLHDAGHGWVSLWVLFENRRAKAFYEREGFVAEPDVKTFEIDGVPIEEIRYWRTLP